jgi:hypothetical protein
MTQRRHATSLADAIAEVDAALPDGWVLLDAVMTTAQAGFDPVPDDCYVMAIAYRYGCDWRVHPRDLLFALTLGLGPDAEMGYSSVGDPSEAFSELAELLRWRH